jgi:K+-transporting ATPase ATPase A chain
VSAAAGIALRDRARSRVCPPTGSNTIGNFWVDLTRATLYVPTAVVARRRAVAVLAKRIQNFSGYQKVTTLEGIEQTIQADRQLLRSRLAIGTSGGGFFNANSAHPFENPTPLSTFFNRSTFF